MTVWLAVLAVAVAAGQAATVAVVWRCRPATSKGLVASLLVQRVIVNTKTGETYSGLWRAREHGMVALADAVALHAENTQIAIDGVLLIPADEVLYVQAP